MWRGAGFRVKSALRRIRDEARFILRNKWISNMTAAANDTVIDLRGLKCPLPALRTRRVLMRLPPGALLVVECTDPLAEIDIPNLLRETGDALEGVKWDNDVLVFRIRKRGG
jgi:tRNA 2-thiouridine synthesizing protein A